jgi:hypothetical protein
LTIPDQKPDGPWGFRGSQSKIPLDKLVSGQNIFWVALICQKVTFYFGGPSNPEDMTFREI